MINLNTIISYFAQQPIIRAWLFGSYARGEETEESDVDIMVEFDKKANVGLMRHAQILCDLERVIGKPVDLVPMGGVYPSLKENIDKDKILIYERS